MKRVAMHMLIAPCCFKPQLSVLKHMSQFVTIEQALEHDQTEHLISTAWKSSSFTNGPWIYSPSDEQADRPGEESQEPHTRTWPSGPSVAIPTLSEILHSKPSVAIRIACCTLRVALLDSGATNNMRPGTMAEARRARTITVALPEGTAECLQLPSGTLISPKENQVIVSMGQCVEVLNCKVIWERGHRCSLIHPTRGTISANCEGGTPTITEALGLALIHEIETTIEASVRAIAIAGETDMILSFAVEGALMQHPITPAGAGTSTSPPPAGEPATEQATLNAELELAKEIDKCIIMMTAAVKVQPIVDKVEARMEFL